MTWLSFLKSKDFDPAEFEKQLASISKKISSTERNITRLKNQKIRVNQTTIIHGSISYLILTFGILIKAHFKLSNLSLIQTCLILGLPTLIFIIWKLYNVINKSQINRNSIYLETLKEDHTAKIEELKEKTKYGQTAALLNRFSEGKDAKAIVDEEIERKQVLLQELDALAKKYEQDQKDKEKQGKGIFDSVLDAVGGTGISGGDVLSPDNRYALICNVCHNHNGLAPPGILPDKVRYICPRCQQPNGIPVPADSGNSTVAIAEEDTPT